MLQKQNMDLVIKYEKTSETASEYDNCDEELKKKIEYL
jgi:hypothetical protein